MKPIAKAAEWLGIIRRQDDHGHEIVDPKPIAIPAGFQRPETLAEQVKRLVQRQVSDAAAQVGEETWDEANDFDIDEDFDPSTPWETVFDPELGREISPAEFAEHWPQIRDEMERNLRNRYRLEAAQGDLEALEKRAVERVQPKKPGGEGVPPSPSSDPPAEQS